MKTSNQLIIVLFGLALTALAWAQDPAETVEETEIPEQPESVEMADPVEPDELIEAVEMADPADQDEIMEAAESADVGDPMEEPQPEMPAAHNGDRVYSFMVHPIYTPDQAEQVYRPLVDFLNARTPFQFELQTSRDFHRYWLELRRGQTPDLVLEDAHLTALRISRNGYTPLVKASEPATFSLLSSDFDVALSDFVARPISSMPAPSLGYLVLTSWFDNPMQQPIIQSNASSWLDAVEIVFSMEADAAIVPHNLVARYPNLEVVHTSDAFPHATISANREVPPEVQQAIQQALVQLHEDDEYFPALHELDIESFVPATAEEFQGIDRWLEQFFTFF
jgi:hypothetical protein